MKNLTDRLATTATGYAAVIDGVLNVMTLDAHRNDAAHNALIIQGFEVASDCRDPECDCIVRLLAKLRPEIKIVAVNVEVADA